MVKPAPPDERWLGMDGLRAVAALGVFFTHAAPSLVPGGGVGVDVFFVISGFLITSLLVREWEATGRISLGTFWLRRIRRLWPAFGCLLLAMAVLALVSRQPGMLAEVAYAGLSVMNWVRALGISSGGLLGHAWTLSAEEQFYVLWPLILALTPALRFRRLLCGVLVALIILITAAKLFLLLTVQPKGGDVHGDGLLLGCLLAIWRPAGWRGGRIALIVVPAVLLAIAYLAPVRGSQLTLFGMYQVASLASALLVGGIVSGLRSRVLESRVLVWLGTRSYAFYLWHYPMLRWVRHFGLGAPVTLMVSLGLTVAAAELSFRLVEAPVRRRWRLPGRAGGALALSRGS